MIIVIEEGACGLWYGISADPTGPYKGLLIAEKSLDEALDKISSTIKAMRDAAQAVALDVKAAGYEDRAMMDPREIVKTIIRVGSAYAEGHGGGRAENILSFLELYAEGQFEVFEENGEVYWCKPGDRMKHPVNKVPA
jgi:hypothetical protein